MRREHRAFHDPMRLKVSIAYTIYFMRAMNTCEHLHNQQPQHGLLNPYSVLLSLAFSSDQQRVLLRKTCDEMVLF